MLYGERPSLVTDRGLLWRAPVWWALPTTGPSGEAVLLDVDDQSGEILHTQKQLIEIAERGIALAENFSYPPD